MPTILSFDIGTRHLAYCALSHTPPTSTLTEATQIDQWQVVDLMSITGTPYDEECLWVTTKTWKVGALRAYLDQKNLSSVGNRDTLVNRIHNDLKQRGIAKVTSTNLCVLASKLYAYLDSQPWMLRCDTIVLENQPCLTNPVMKSVQMLLYGYFLYNGVWKTHQNNQKRVRELGSPVQLGGAVGAGNDGVSVEPLPRVMLTSASNKLKVCQTVLRKENDSGVPDPVPPGAALTTATTSAPNVKSDYKQRKKDAIELTSKLLQQWRTEATTTGEVQVWTAWLEKLEGSCAKEKDDLSDSFLQGLYVLRKHVVERKRDVRKARDKGGIKAKKKEK